MDENPKMFCYQCQETANNEGCLMRGVCGKDAETANLQDLLIWLLKGISFYVRRAEEKDLTLEHEEADVFVTESLFSTITNANFDPRWFEDRIGEAIQVREELAELYASAHQEEYGVLPEIDLPEAATWESDDPADLWKKGEQVGVLATAEEEIRSLRELLTYGIKGIAAYTDHAYILSEKDEKIFDFIHRGLAATVDDRLGADDLFDLVLEAGEMAVSAMSALDKANTRAYGDPEPTEVELGTRDRPGILISGHDLKDMEELLKQTAGEGVDVYTHGEMLPANSYPAFKKYDHFVGNYGNSWWKQGEEFEKFNGPILMTTNCLIPPKDSYKDRVYTTGVVGYPELKHVPDREEGESKDFSALIEQAKETAPPEELETGTIPAGFAHDAVSDRAEEIVDCVQQGKITRFVVMAGCDGRYDSRNYFTEVARELPEEAVILTAGCAKYRYNKLDLGRVEGTDIPRVLDAGQCNDSYSLVLIAKELARAVGADDINDLPISYDIAWYEQKAVAVLLALLSLGVKGIRLGPSLPAFLSEGVLEVLVDKFDIKPTGDVEEDVAAITEGV